MKKIDFLKVINEKCPEIKVESFSINIMGENNIVCIVNGDMIFRFPKDDFSTEKFMTEINNLKAVSSVNTLQVPNLIGYEIKPTPFMYYEMIIGEVLSKEVFEALENKERIVVQLHNFLEEIHNVEKDKIVFKTVYNKEYWINVYERVQREIFDLLDLSVQNEVVKLFDDFLQGYDEDIIDSKVIHGDMVSANVIYQEDKLIGIVDFAEMSFGDPAIDIGMLCSKYGYGEKFLEILIEKYDIYKEMKDRIVFYSKAFIFCEILEFYQKYNIFVFHDCLKNIML
jgi:aminoglycoside 2''-phosphotransferase